MNFNPTRRTIISTATGLSLAVFAVAGTGVANAYHTVTLQVDGVSKPVSGFSRTVGEVLDAAGVTVSEHDLVAPTTDETLSDGQQIVVRTAKQYSLAVDGKAPSIWSTGSSLGAVLADGASTGVVTMVADRSESRPELPVLATAGTITVIADGQTHAVDASTSDTASTLLSKAGVKVSAIDPVQWTTEGEGGVALKVTRVARGERTETTTVAHSSENRDDSSLTKGTTKVIQAGKDGSVETTYYEEKVDGKVTVSAKISEKKTDPVTEIVAVGTKEAVAATTASSTSSSGSSASGSSSASSSSAASVSGVWAALAQCESGGNPSTNTGNGYYGLYQFSLATWQSLGGSGLPSDNSAAEQTRIAQILQARSGWGQWPACAASLGLL